MTFPQDTTSALIIERIGVPWPLTLALMWLSLLIGAIGWQLLLQAFIQEE